MPNSFTLRFGVLVVVVGVAEGERLMFLQVVALVVARVAFTSELFAQRS
jgi:hypothetical protein